MTRQSFLCATGAQLDKPWKGAEIPNLINGPFCDLNGWLLYLSDFL